MLLFSYVTCFKTSAFLKKRFILRLLELSRKNYFAKKDSGIFEPANDIISTESLPARKSNRFYDDDTSRSSKSKMARSLYRRENYDSRSQSSAYITSEYVLTKNRFLSHCEMLRNSIDLSAKKLVHFPTNSVYFGLEAFFIREILPFWWPVFKPKLKDVYASDLIKFTIFGLHKIWKKTSVSSIISSINTESLLFLIDSTLESINMISPKNYDLLLECIRTFSEAFLNDPARKVELTLKLSKSFESFLYNIANEKQLRFQTAPEHIARITWNLHNLNVEKPADVLIGPLVDLFSKELEHQPLGAVNYMFKLCQISFVLLHWNIDASKYKTEFWSRWFRKAFDLYPLLPRESGFLNWACLLCALKMMIKFDREIEFVQFKSVWLDYIQLNKSKLPRDELKTIVDDLNTKYNRYPNKIDSISLKEIISALE